MNAAIAIFVAVLMASVASKKKKEARSVDTKPPEKERVIEDPTFVNGFTDAQRVMTAYGDPLLNEYIRDRKQIGRRVVLSMTTSPKRI